MNATAGRLRLRRRLPARWASIRVTAAAAGFVACLGAVPLTASAADPAAPLAPRLALQPCALDGVPHEARCGRLVRPLDPARPAGTAIEVHVAVVPAQSRQPLPDPVVFLAGGPGQSAIDLAGPLARRFASLGYRRHLVFVDQRGTGRSAPLICAEDRPDSPARPLAEALDTPRRLAALRECRTQLQRLPHGDLRHYLTVHASADLDAVRAALGAEQINLVGASYGTRAGLDYMRQFPQRVRRAVLDGLAPPDMVLPLSAGQDGSQAFDALLARCEAEPACARRHPDLRTQWQRLLASLPRQVSVTHPYTGKLETVTIDRDLLLGLRRAPMYLPLLASGLPHALTEAAAHGRFGPLLALAGALSPAGGQAALASGMHFSVICAEDLPRVAAQAMQQATGELALYRDVCADWPRGAVPEDFYRMPPAPAATLLLSGALDPATPPRHGEHVARALGTKARHLVAPGAGHGVLAQPCGPDLARRFIGAADDAAALAADPGCVTRLPAPAWFVPPGTPDGTGRS